MSQPTPKLIVFDLDYTLWPFYIDSIYGPLDKLKSYPEVPDIIKKLHEDGFVLGIASRTSAISDANKLVDRLGWNKYFTYKEIYPGCKVTHFNKFKKHSGIEFKDMLFFDDENRNIRDLQKEGVTSIFVEDGVNNKVVQDGLAEYAKQHAKE